MAQLYGLGPKSVFSHILKWVALNRLVGWRYLGFLHDCNDHEGNDEQQNVNGRIHRARKVCSLVTRQETNS